MTEILIKTRKHQIYYQICASTDCDNPDCKKVFLISPPVIKPSESRSTVLKMLSNLALSTALTTHGMVDGVF